METYQDKKKEDVEAGHLLLHALRFARLHGQSKSKRGQDY